MGVVVNISRSRLQRDVFSNGILLRYKRDLRKEYHVNIRRYYIPGSAVFITQIVQDREPIFRNEDYLNLLHEILRNVKEIYPFSMLSSRSK
jgi:hypothetical protein